MTVAARYRRSMLSALAVAVLALHLAFLFVFGPAWFDVEGRPAPPPRAVQVRSVASPPALAVPLPAQGAAEPRQPTAVLAVRAAARAAAAPTQAPASVAAPAVLDDPKPSAEAAVADAIELPIYATRLPPAGRWHYTMRRGLAVGEADLSWTLQPDARYALQLEGRIAGVTLLDWASQGQLDAAGIAPERFAQRRRGRDRQAANFQREAGKITFSGPTHELPLLPGAQDRLSWILQLPAIVAAAPERFVAGSKILLFVAGARGHGDVWSFGVQGSELLAERPALKLTREARSLYDTRIEIWLDPAEHYLPLRVLQTPSGGGAALELVREPEPR